MVNTNTLIEERWSKLNPSGLDDFITWHQSKPGSSLRSKWHNDFIYRKLKREKEQRLGNRIRQISNDCKEMLKRKMEEIDLYNSTLNKPKSHNTLSRSQIASDKGTHWTHQGHWDDIWSTEQNKSVGLVSMQDDVIEIKGTLYSTRVTTFNEYVGFLNLVKQDEIISQEWDSFRKKFDKVVKWFYNHYLEKSLPGPIPPIINGVQIHLFDLYKLIEGLGGYLSVYFENEFGTIGEILGLSKQDGEEIKRCYINYLDIFTSYYKTARVPKEEHNTIPTPNKEAVSKKGKEKMEHFGIELEDTRYEPDSFSPIHPSIKGTQTMNKDN
ncbi:ARID DNA-binding domain-containing protein [Tanacetum coccineum]